MKILFLTLLLSISCSDTSMSSGGTIKTDETSQRNERETYSEDVATTPVAVAGAFHLLKCESSDLSEDVGCKIIDKRDGAKVRLSDFYRSAQLNASSDVRTTVRELSPNASSLASRVYFSDGKFNR